MTETIPPPNEPPPMSMLSRLEKLKPQLLGKIIEVEPDLYVMLGGECFSASMKGVSAFGSLKHVIEKHGEDYLKGKTLIDASSGNFARALAHLAEYLGLQCEVVVSTKATQATIDLIKTHGAKVTVGGDTTLECYRKAQQLTEAAPDKYVLTGQLENWGSPYGHYEITGPQIIETLPDVSEVYLAMGTGGGTHGVAKYLHEHAPHIDVYVTVVHPGNRIVGTFSREADFETPFIKEVRAKNWLTGELPITEQDAKDGMVAMRKEHGPLVGISAGGVYTAYTQRKAEGKTKGTALILAWDGHDRWLEKLI